MKYLNLLVLLVLIFVQNYLCAQFETEPYKAPDNVTAKIESKMNSEYGGKYTLTIYFIMDSLINRIPFNYMDERFEDPYGTLKGTSVFSCQKFTDSEDSSIVGVYKDGKILWDSGPIIFGDILNRLSFCKDINKDGSVDIGLISEYANFSENYNPNNITDYLWILSWNGDNGVFINDYDVNTHKSRLVPGPFKLFDETGDGINEISSMYSYDDEYTHTPVKNPPPDYPYVTYGWNGRKYGLWPDVYQLKEGDFYPAIWIKPTIKCNVISVDSLLRFQYIITNGKNSLQAIETINFLDVPVKKIDTTSKYSDTIESFPGKISGSWYFRPNLDLNSYSGLIEPGETKSGYWYKGIGLPYIVWAYFRGLIPIELTRPSTNEMELDAIYNNSVKRKTIGLKAISQHLDILSLIDTLTSYKHQAASLDWIDNQGIANSLDSKLDNAKKKLAAGDSTAAVQILNAFVNEVEAQKGKHLSSEAYALLKYNADYLISRLK